jgi:hypothetical protein
MVFLWRFLVLSKPMYKAQWTQSLSRSTSPNHWSKFTCLLCKIYMWAMQNPNLHCVNPHAHSANHENHFVMGHAQYRPLCLIENFVLPY